MLNKASGTSCRSYNINNMNNYYLFYTYIHDTGSRDSKLTETLKHLSQIATLAEW